MQRPESCSRRSFLHAAGLGFGSLAALGAVPQARAAEKCEKNTPGSAKFNLGLASYTTRKFGLEDTLKMAKRVGLDSHCQKQKYIGCSACVGRYLLHAGIHSARRHLLCHRRAYWRGQNQRL